MKKYKFFMKKYKFLAEYSQVVGAGEDGCDATIKGGVQNKIK